MLSSGSQQKNVATATSSTVMTIPHYTPPSGPTLLPASVAAMVSLFSKSTSISIRIGSKVGATLLDTARSGTMTSLELSRAAVEGIVRRGQRGVIVRRERDAEIEYWATKGVNDPRLAPPHLTPRNPGDCEIAC
jgi:hypothetical protein